MIVYEMLTGRMAFAGEIASETMAFVMTREPEWSALPAETPARLRDLLRRCFVKDPRSRLGRVLPWAIAVASLAAAGMALWVPWSSVPQPSTAVRLNVNLGDDAVFLSNISSPANLALSPDGAILALVAGPYCHFDFGGGTGFRYLDLRMGTRRHVAADVRSAQRSGSLVA